MQSGCVLLILLTLITFEFAPTNSKSHSSAPTRGQKPDVQIPYMIYGGEYLTQRKEINPKGNPVGSPDLAISNVAFQSPGKSLGTHRQGREGGPTIKGEIQRKNKEGKLEDGSLYYHYYPHNQHLFNLPECATQQVCNAVYVRLNFTQPLCACPALSNPCSASFLSNDKHTVELKMSHTRSNAVTLVKTCEPIETVRPCRKPQDWALLALQNSRTGKAHYLVICSCPNSSLLEGPLNHDQPTYAQVPGIRVFGMVCNSNRRARRSSEILKDLPHFPWEKIEAVVRDTVIINDLLSES